MADPSRPFALLAEFCEPEPMVAGAVRLRKEGWRVEIFTPFPVEGMKDAIGFRESKVPIATLIGGILGVLAGFLIQIGVNLDYPLDVGGRPLVAMPAFLLIALETGVLCAVFAAIGTMLAASRLPRLHYPLFDAERFGVGCEDRFFLAVLAEGEAFDMEAAHLALRRQRPLRVTEIAKGAEA